MSRTLSTFGGSSARPGYLYVLVHPSDPDLYKIGVTIHHPDRRLAQHNSQHEKYVGRIVKETGLKWRLKTYIAVADVYWAESVFWSATGLADVPYRGGIEVAKLEWKLVQAGLDAAAKAKVRPTPQEPDWVFAYDTWMHKRLEGRGITLLGHVRSKFGKSNFRCINGHQWRTKPLDVAEGGGCPQCGTGAREPEEIRQAVGASVLYLLVHPNKPGLIRIELTSDGPEGDRERNSWGGWEMHRYRRVEEPALAEKMIWQLLDHPMPENREPVALDLRKAEQAFRGLVSLMQHELALMEKAKEGPPP